MKSVETKFNEALAAIKKAGRDKQYMEATKNFTSATTIETRLNAAEAVLKDVGVVRESAPVKKNNGTADNFVENNPFRPLQELNESFSAGYIKETAPGVVQKADKVMIYHMLKRGEINEAQHRKLLGLKPKEYTNLSEAQRREYDSAVRIGVSEQDAFKIAKMVFDDRVLKEVSHT